MIVSKTDCVHSAWASKNSGSVRTRTISAAAYNGKGLFRPALSFILTMHAVCVQLGNVISANIYRTDDKPLYHRGNSVLLAINLLALLLFVFTKFYYIKRNKSRERKWNAMSVEVSLAFWSMVDRDSD